ncbi:hypothetical protein Pmani_038595, partial [Petrolisthes manimaculis]
RVSGAGGILLGAGELVDVGRGSHQEVELRGRGKGGKDRERGTCWTWPSHLGY